MEKNIYVDKAFRLINSGRSLFVTGKAGTGKTTLLRKVVERAKNNKESCCFSSYGCRRPKC